MDGREVGIVIEVQKIIWRLHLSFLSTLIPAWRHDWLCNGINELALAHVLLLFAKPLAGAHN